MPRNCDRPWSSCGASLLVVLLWSGGNSLAASRLCAQQPVRVDAASPTAFGPHNSVTAFVNVAVIPMDQERVLRDQTVVIRDGRIAALGPAQRVAVPAGAARVDGRGKFLIPGLSDMHTHEFTNEESWLRDYRLLTYLALGITTVRDMHSSTPDADEGRALLALKRQVATGELLGPYLYLAGDLKGPLYSGKVGPEDFEKVHFDIATIGLQMVALKAAGYDFVKFRLEQLPQPLYDTIITAAFRVGLRIVGHVPAGEGLGLGRALHDHFASIEHLTGYLSEIMRFNGEKSLASLTNLDRADLDTTAWAQPTFRPDAGLLREMAVATRRAEVWNCPTLVVLLAASRMGTERGDTNGAGYLVNKRRWAFASPIVKALRDAGAGLLLGTDAPPKPPEFSVHRELELLVQAGLTPYQALETGTQNVAQFLGTLDSAGTVTVGKRADLVLLAANPLEDIRHSQEIVGVMRGGHWLLRTDLDARRVALRRQFQQQNP